MRSAGYNLYFFTVRMTSVSSWNHRSHDAGRERGSRSWFSWGTERPAGACRDALGWGVIRRVFLSVLVGVLFIARVLTAQNVNPLISLGQETEEPAQIHRTEDALGRKDLRALGIRDVIASTLENNMDIAVERVEPEIREQDITIQKAAFDPTFAFGSRTRSQDIPTSGLTHRSFYGHPDWDIVTAYKTDTTTMSAEVDKRTVTGAQFVARYDYSRDNSSLPFTYDTGSFQPTFNPEYNTDLTFSVTQPLLKGAGVDYNRRGIKVAMLNKQASRYNFEWQVMQRVLETQENYWQLVSRIRQLGIARESLRRAKRLLADNRARLRVGQMARADVIEAEAQVAEQQKTIVAAKYDLLIAENNLKKTMNDPDLTVLTDIAVVPLDQPTSEPRKIDWVYCVDRALNLRPDYASIKAQLEANKVEIKRRKNELYPEIDLEASMVFNGLGNTFGWATDVMSPGHGHKFLDSYIGAKVIMPLDGNRAAKAAYKQAQLSAAQMLRSLKNQELEIIRQVREAVRLVENYLQIIDASRTVRELRARQLEAKEIKRKAGTGIPFEVVQAQEDLVKAEGAELDALINYNIWLARLSYRMGTILEELDIEIEEKPAEK